MVGELIAGRYELEELIGAGGMSSVYRARDTLLERRVALKVMHEQFVDDEDYVRRFRHEARAVAQLSHPNIVTVIDRGEQDGRQFIVFEYVEGENLKEIVDRTGPLPVPEALRLTLQVAEALAFAHHQGLVHRDVKPQNVLLNGDGRAKVTDFGIARSLDLEQGLTQTGTVLGTSNYIAPEQAQGRKVDALTDVYSLGVVLFELLTGEVPFQGENFVAVAMRHINDPVPSVRERRPDVSPRVDAAVRRAMAKQAGDRFDSMDDVVAELGACLAELEDDAEATAVRRAPVYAPPRRSRSRRLWPALVVAGLLATGAAVGGVLATRGSDGAQSSGANASGGTPGSAPIRLAGVTSYDPDGDRHEHNEAVARATDGNPGTYWTTEHYRSFTKPGVGLVLDARRTVEPKRLTVTSDTPGFSAAIQAGDSPGGTFHSVSGTKTVGSSTTYDLRDAKARYFVVWITRLPPGGVAHVNEVRVR